MGTHEIDLFTHSLSVDPAFRAGILADDPDVWASIPLAPDEQDALRRADIGWLYQHGANDFLLHNMFRFGVGGITIEQYVEGIKSQSPSRPDRATENS